MADKYGKRVKEVMVKEMKDLISDNKGFVVSSIENIKASEIDELRKKIKQSGSRYMVVKNRLARIVLEDVGVPELTETFKEKKILGLGFVVDDPVQIAKIMADFAKKNKGFNIANGYLEGRVLDEKRIKELAALPGREQLIAMVLQMMNAPITGFVGVLSSVLRSVVYALNAIKEKKESGE